MRNRNRFNIKEIQNFICRFSRTMCLFEVGKHYQIYQLEFKILLEEFAALRGIDIKRKGDVFLIPIATATDTITTFFAERNHQRIAYISQ